MTEHHDAAPASDEPDQLAQNARVHYVLGLCNTWKDHRKAGYHFRRFLELAPDAPEAEIARNLLRITEMVQD